jgi:hypothetical protein
MLIHKFQQILATTLVTAIISGGCTNSTLRSPARKNDTLEVMRLLFDSTLSSRYLPDFSALRRNSPFADSILMLRAVDQDTDIRKYFLEDLKDIKLKFISRDEVCSLATAFRSDTTEFPFFLQITAFRKTDTGYEVYLKNSCAIPKFDKYGNRRMRKLKGDRLDSIPCMFGFLCGGGVSMVFKKAKDSLVARIDGILSD